MTSFDLDFNMEPVFDGINHVGEQAMLDIVSKYGAEAFVDALYGTSLTPSTRATLIRLFARVEPPPSKEVRLKLVEQSISSTSVEVRDAIVQAVELWEDPDAASILGEHQEVVPWLAEYINAVVCELQEQPKQE